MATIRYSILGALFALGLCFATPVQALAVTLTMVTDTLLFGRAILSGDYQSLGDSFQFVHAKKADGTEPVHWSADVMLHKFSNATHDQGLNITEVEGRHISRPPPHAGELSPGPLLALGGILSPLYTALTDDFTDALVREVRVLHDNQSHFDIMTTTLIDLAPNDPKSVTAGAAEEFRMVIDFRHIVPEPGGLLLVSSALALLGLAKRRITGLTPEPAIAPKY